MIITKALLFKGLGEDLLDEIGSALVEKSYSADEYIFRRGEPADYLYLLESGRIRLTVGDLGTVARTVTNPGDAFGFSSLVGSGAYTASALCLTDVRVLVISGCEMDRLLEKEPGNGLIFYRQLARLIRRQLIESYRILNTYEAEKKPHSYG